MSYLVGYGLGCYFPQQKIKELVDGNSFFTLHFDETIKLICDSFMTRFQAEEPMIHLLYSNCEKLLKVTMGRLMKSEEYMHKKGNIYKR